MKNKLISLIALTLLLFSPSIFANSLESAADQIAQYLTQTAVKIQKSHELVISVVNIHSEQPDMTSRKIETELYFALEQRFPDFKLVLLGESVTGMSLKNAVHVKGTYEKKGNIITIRVQCVSSMDGTLLAQTEAVYNTTESRRKTLVAVLDLEANMLNNDDRKIFSDIFRSAFIDLGVFDMASSADIDKMNPDTIQQTMGCTRDSCATIIGEQLGVDRVISSSLRKSGSNTYFVSAKMLDIQDGSILSSKVVRHEGDLSNLDKALVQLAEELTGAESSQPTVQQAPMGQAGMIALKSLPSEATIYLDGKKLKEKTDTLLQGIPIGKHTILVVKGNKGAKKDFLLLPNKVEEMELRLETLKEMVQIRTIPSAEIYLDGKYVGNSPLNTEIPVGKHEVEFKKDGYETVTLMKDIRPFEKNIFSQRLTRVTQLNVNSSPGMARLYLDSKYKGYTPITIETTPGEHTVKLMHSNYHVYEKKITVNPYETNKIDVTLIPPVSLEIVYSPPEAELKLDENTISAGRDNIDLETLNKTVKERKPIYIGKHTITLTHPEAVRPIEDAFQVEEGSRSLTKIYELEINPEYIAQLEQDIQIKEYESNLSSWKWKYRLSLLGGALAAAYAYLENQKAVEASEKQQESEAAILTATTSAEAADYRDKALEFNEEVKTYDQNSQIGTIVSAAFLGLATWIWLDEPEKPKFRSFQSKLTYKGSLKLSLSAGF